MQSLHRELEAAAAASEAATEAYLQGTNDDWLAAARAAGLAAHRAERIAFGGDQAARLADARERAQAAACSLRIAARLVAEYAAAPPTQDPHDSGKNRVRISPDIPRDWCDVAASTELAAARGGADADTVYEAAIDAADKPSFVLDIIGRITDLEASEAACRQHRHQTDTRTNVLDAAHWIRHVALRVTALAAADRGDFLPDLRTCCRKVRHATIEEAEQAAEEGRSLRGVRLRVYRCDICGGWHLTSKLYL